MEPRSTMQKWTGHWNYQWGNRISVSAVVKPKWRMDGDDIYTVQDRNGMIWKMDKEAFEEFMCHEQTK